MSENGPYPVARQTSAVSRGDAGVRRLADVYPGTARQYMGSTMTEIVP